MNPLQLNILMTGMAQVCEQPTFFLRMNYMRELFLSFQVI